MVGALYKLSAIPAVHSLVNGDSGKISKVQVLTPQAHICLIVARALAWVRVLSLQMVRRGFEAATYPHGTEAVSTAGYHVAATFESPPTPIK